MIYGDMSNIRLAMIASRTLKEIQRLLDDYNIFIRVHHSFLINLNEVLQYVRGDGGYVMMSDGSHINVSRNKKKNLEDFFNVSLSIPAHAPLSPV